MGVSYRDRVPGCLLGGAVGDALGAPIEFDSLAKIRQLFGPGGLGDFDPAYGRLGAITDDTQMTLFTGEGVIRAHNPFLNKGVSHVPTVVHHAYLRWLKTQGGPLQLAEELRGHAAGLRRHRGRTGGRLNPCNLRTRLLTRVVEKANERREERGDQLLPSRVTPHTLRRTFASLALSAGRDPRWVMAQLGHTDARLTLNVYAR